jgi:hypothetical protein
MPGDFGDQENAPGECAWACGEGTESDWYVTLSMAALYSEAGGGLVQSMTIEPTCFVKDLAGFQHD